MILSSYGCPFQTFITPNPPVKIRAVSATIQACDQDKKIPFYGDFYEILILLSHPHGCVLCGLAQKKIFITYFSALCRLKFLLVHPGTLIGKNLVREDTITCMHLFQITA